MEPQRVMTKLLRQGVPELKWIHQQRRSCCPGKGLGEPKALDVTEVWKCVLIPGPFLFSTQPPLL